MASSLTPDRKRTPIAFGFDEHLFFFQLAGWHWVLISEWALNTTTTTTTTTNTTMSHWAPFNWSAWLFVRHFPVFASLKCEKIWGKGLKVRDNMGVCPPRASVHVLSVRMCTGVLVSVCACVCVCSWGVSWLCVALRIGIASVGLRVSVCRSPSVGTVCGREQTD